MSDETPPGSEYSSSFGSEPEPESTDPVGAPRRAQPGRVHHGIRWGRIAIITIAVLFATVAAAVGYFGLKLNQEVTSISRNSSLLPTGSRPPSASNTANTTYTAMNILLIGSDTRGTDQGRSDSFIVVHISADRKSVYLVSFPRDMWVTVPGYGTAPRQPCRRTGAWTRKPSSRAFMRMSRLRSSSLRPVATSVVTLRSIDHRRGP